MGVTINETITLDSGLTVTDAYASVARNEIRVEKKTEEVTNYMLETPITKTITTYTTKCRFTMWVTPELRVSGSKDIGSIEVEVDSDTPPIGNVYELLYNKFKTIKTCTDSI